MERAARDLIASASEDEEEDKEGSEEDDDMVNDKDMISKYRSLLTDIQKKEDKGKGKMGNLEVSWKEEEEEEEEEQEEAEEELGPWQKYLQKKKDKKKRKKVEKDVEDPLDDDDDLPDGVDMNDPFFAEEFGEEFKKESKDNKKSKKKKRKQDEIKDEVPKNTALDLMVMDEEEEDKKHFNFKDIVEKETQPGKAKKKWKKKKKTEIVKEKEAEDDFSVDVEDNRFSALFNRPEYNIDPTESNFKKTKNMEKIIDEKLKRIDDSGKAKKNEWTVSEAKKPRLDADVSLALKSVKTKWKQNAKSKKVKKM